MKTLVLCDDLYHSGAIVEAGLKPLEEQAISFDFRWDTSGFVPEDLEGYRVVCLCKANRFSAEKEGEWLNEAVQRRFVAFVENGGGLLVLHAGTTAAKTAPLLRELTGCVFDHHPEQCAVQYVVTKETPITQHAHSFAGEDEHYFLRFDAQDAEIFLESRSAAGVQPAGYFRQQGKGRVCVMTPGHTLPVWRNKEYQIMLKNAIFWCGGYEI